MSFHIIVILTLTFYDQVNLETQNGILSKTSTDKYTIRQYRPTYSSDYPKTEYEKNPERGFRYENIVTLDLNLTNPFTGSKQNGDILRKKYQEDINGEQYRIVQQYVYLTKYLHGNLDDKAFIALKHIFKQAKSAGVKLLLKFAYKFNGNSKVEEPYLYQLKRHMYQLKPILTNEVIYAFQIGFIGLGGEQRLTLYNRAQQLEIFKMFYTECLPPNRKVTFRHKSSRDMLISSLLPEYSEDRLRIGFHNDYYTLDAHPKAKYSDHLFNSSIYNDIKELSGNTIYDVEMPDSCENDTNCLNFVPPNFAIGTITRFIELGTTTMSIVHNLESCILHLRNKLIFPFHFKHQELFYDKDYFYDDIENRFVGRSAFEYIRDHLGYRLVLEEAVYPTRVSTNSFINVRVTLRNYGFAKPVNVRPMAVILLDDQNSTLWASYFSEGVESCVPARSCYFNINSYFPRFANGTYNLALWLPDESILLRDSPAYDIRLANSGFNFKFIETSNHRFNVFGSVKVSGM